MSGGQKPLKSLELVVDNFGHIHSDGIYIPVKRFTWKNQNKVQIQLITYGATITSIKYPNKRGIIDDVVLGFDDMKGYLEHQEYYFGIVGRYSNFIRHGHFTIGKKEYKVTQNIGTHHYNGGDYGFDKKLWDYFVMGNKVVLSHFSPDGTEGFPGDMIVFATYELTSNNEFRIDIKAHSTKQTICNVSNSMFFNLAGHNSGPEEMNKHEVLINADCVTITNDENLPTGEIRSVFNTMYDFQVPVKINHIIDKYDGFSSNFCVNRGVEQGNSFVMRLIHPDGGRMLEIYSNQYGIQLETSNNFPYKTDSCSPIKCKNPYIKNNVVTFELLDEIYNRVADVIALDKSNKYNDLLKLIRELQKKDGTLYRSASGSSLQSKNAEKGIKRVKINLDSPFNFQLNPVQTKYVERIVDKINVIPEPNLLLEFKDVLDQLTTRCKEELSIKIPTLDKSEEQVVLKDIRGKKGAKYCRHGSISLMTQNYPDSCNNANFPSSVLKPGAVYHHSIVYKFLVKCSNVGMAGYLP